MFASYEEAYAFYAPVFRRQWKGRDLPAAVRARADILDTLRLHEERTPYVGKLYAELDAVRDVIRAYA